jgi:hypothetical protein
MRRRLFSVLMVFVALSLALSLVATLAPEASAQGGTIIPGGPTGGLNKWVRHDLPTTQHWQMAPNTDVWYLTATDDGTLFALVEDTSGAADLNAPPGGPGVWDGLRWAVFPAYSDVALFKSTDGGYEWELMWHQPASDRGAPLAVVPQPGYVDGDASHDVVFVATGTRYLSPGGPAIFIGGPQEGNIYRSMDGGDNFTRVTPRNPAVTLVAGGTITSLDVAENVDHPGTYMALVGVSSLDDGAPRGVGVYTWNEYNDRDWRDKQVSNALPPAPFPGSMPAGNGLDVWAVKASPTYTEDQIFMAVVSDIGPGDPAGQPRGIYLCLWDGNDGVWGGDVDSPTNGQIALNTYAWSAVIDVADDFNRANNVFVGLDGSGADDVYRIVGRPTVTGPSLVQARGLGALRISDMQFIGSAGTGSLFVGCETPLGTTSGPAVDGQAQVFRGEAMTVWPTWTPSFKPPSGAWPVFVTLMGEKLMAAGGGDGWTYGGVHRCAAGCVACAAGQRMVFNGVGLMDDIAVSEDIPGYVNPGTYAPLMLGTSWCMAEAHAEEVSPMYETDNLIYVSTFSFWDADIAPAGNGPQPEAGLSLWRLTDSAHWERVLKEFVTMPTAGPAGLGNAQYRGKAWQLSGLDISTSAVDTWWPRVSRVFSEDPYVFLLGGRGDALAGGGSFWWQDMFWYSPDLGDTWINMLQMPLGAATGGLPVPGLSEAGWWVQDNNTVFAGDVRGWIYKTTDRGAAWTVGALTAAGLEVTSIVTSPIYSETGSSDKCVLVGTFDPSLPGGVLAGSDVQHEIWISQDGCEQDLENVGAEICSAPTWAGPIGVDTALLSGYGLTVVNFDPSWETNRMVYSAASTWLDLWQLVGPGATRLTRIDSTDVGVYRTEVNLNEPSASTWEQVWDADDFNAIAPEPQPVEGMLPTWITFRYAFISDLQIGADGTMYLPFAVYDFSRNFNAMVPLTHLEKAPSPHGPGRFTAGGVLRCLDGTQDTPDWDAISQGLGEWDGLFLNRAPVGDSNTLISLAWDFQEWRWKLAIYDDTLATKGAPTAPTADSNGVGSLIGNEVNVDLEWADLDATVYEWQVDDDSGFVAPVIASGVTSDPLATVTGLEPGVKYWWHVRALEPALSRWSDAQSFTTTMVADIVAPTLKAPKAGVTTLETKPLFQWSGVGWADRYQIQVATDSGFGSAALAINENLGNVQAFEAPSDLAYDTYYWRVKAMSDTSETEWSSMGVFTVAEEMPDGESDAWVWIFLALGVIMLILIVVLIIKRRATV